jgi:hypothetical protein
MDDDTSIERKRRADKRRQTIVLVKRTIETQDLDFNPLSGAEALSLVWPLTRESWSLGRHRLPNYDRSTIPCRFVREL